METNAMAESVTETSKTFAEKLLSYLEKNREDLDVKFIVGSAKKEVWALKVALKASSPAIKKLFEEKWGFGVAKLSGIPLPNFDPEAFEIFLKLMLCDDWSEKRIEGMMLSTETLLNLIQITKEFEILEMERNLNSLTDKILKDFSSFAESKEFLELSCKNLETVLSKDFIAMKEIEIFQCAMRWVKFQCEKCNKDPTVKNNMRQILGSAIFHIRFPLMSIIEFTDVCTTGVLTDAEELEVFRHISFSLCPGTQKSTMLSSSQLPFITKTRSKDHGVPHFSEPPIVTIDQLNELDTQLSEVLDRVAVEMEAFVHSESFEKEDTSSEVEQENIEIKEEVEKTEQSVFEEVEKTEQNVLEEVEKTEQVVLEEVEKEEQIQMAHAEIGYDEVKLPEVETTEQVSLENAVETEQEKLKVEEKTEQVILEEEDQKQEAINEKVENKEQEQVFVEVAS